MLDNIEINDDKHRSNDNRNSDNDLKFYFEKPEELVSLLQDVVESMDKGKDLDSKISAFTQGLSKHQVFKKI